MSRVVRSLIPRTSVPSSAVLQLLGSQKGQTLSLQLLIIRWIVLIYDIIDNKADVHAIYGIIFYYLQNDELVCAGMLIENFDLCLNYYIASSNLSASLLHDQKM